MSKKEISNPISGPERERLAVTWTWHLSPGNIATMSSGPTWEQPGDDTKSVTWFNAIL